MKFRILIDSLLVGQESKKHFTDAIYYEPEDLAEDNYARLFLHIEIKDNPKSSKQVTQTVFQALKEYIYKDLKKDPFDSFEDSLKKVNQALNNLRHDDKDWIGKVNATCGLFSGDSLHFSTTGDAEVILSRKGSMNVISEGLAPADTVYDNMFLNIASGNLKEEDILIISSRPLTTLLQEDQIINAISKKQLANSVLSLEKILDDNYHSSLLVSIQNSYRQAEVLEAENLDIEDTNEEIIQNDSDNKNPKPLAKKTASKYAKKGKKLLYKLKEIFVPPEHDILDEEISSIDLENTFADEDKGKVTMETMTSLQDLDNLEDMRNASNKSIESFQPNITPDSNSKLSNTINLFKRNLFISLKGMNPNKKDPKIKKSSLIAIVILILVSTFAIHSVYSKHIENQEIEALRAKILNVDNLIEKAKGRNIIDEKEKAREVLHEIESEMEVLSASEYLKNEIELKYEEIDELRDAINEIVRFDVPKEFSNLAAKYDGIKATDLVFLDDTMYAVTKDALLKLVLDQTVLIPATNLNDGEFFTEAVEFEEDKSIVLYTNQNRLIEFKRDEFTELKLSDANIAWKPNIDLDTFGRRVYFLDPSSDQIWKYPKQGNSFLNAQEYKPLDVDISLSIDMSIVGDIYILNKGGVIHRTNARKTVDFNFENMPANADLSGATRIEMNPTLKQLFILDPANNRVMVTGYRGYYAKQYIFPNVNDMQDIFVNENTQKMYVLTSDKVLEVDLER